MVVGVARLNAKLWDRAVERRRGQLREYEIGEGPVSKGE